MPYQNLQQKVNEIISKNKLSIDNRLTEICELLQNSLDYYDWVGFYFANHKEKTLHLKAFAGEETDHTIIPFGKGICGQVAVSNHNFVVEDVQAQDNYIACNINVKAEIVIPLFKDGKNVGQIDVDSNTSNPFTEKDERFLEWVNEQVSLKL
ncbi:MAG: GAF domain-containing protein [Flavobacteriaceae bacterium]|nr:GAF domain-containing protein [Flavobacteriaceae bacterium]